MTSELRAVLEQQRNQRDAVARETGVLRPRVFFRLVGKRGGKAVPLPDPIKRFTKAWKNACRAAGCPGAIPHDFGRTVVRNLSRRGVPREIAMAMVGHKTDSVYRRYDIVSHDDLRAAASKLEGLVWPMPSAEEKPAQTVKFGQARR